MRPFSLPIIEATRSLCHARACPGHPRLSSVAAKTWMAGTSPAITAEFGARPSCARHPQAQFSADAVMRVRDGDRERVGRIRRFRLSLGEKNLQHHRDLVLVGMSG